MSSAMDEAAGHSSRHAGTASISSRTDAADQTASSIQLRNGVASPQSPGSDADSTINTSFAPSILASRLGRNIYSSAGAAGSTLSLTGSGFNSPSLALTGFNAVSTVLNNPSKRQHPIDPKSSRFAAVTPNHVPAEIPKVKKAELDPYLSSVRPEWDRFMRNQSMGRQGKATIEQQQQQQQRASTQDSSYDSEPLGKANRRHRPTSSIASLSADLQAVPPPQARKRLPNLSAVPQVFFLEDFDLGNPYTFDQVTERHKVDASSPAEQRGNAPTYDVALNQMLQEKLSYYSDVIEQHLIIEIGQQSSSFFAALENLNDLNAEAESCLAKIGDLKAELQQIDEKQAKKGLAVIREQQHRRHLEHKQTTVQNVREIIERRDLVRLLLQQGETEDALEVLNKLKAALRRPNAGQDEASSDRTSPKGSTQNPADAASEVALAELKCLSSIPAQLEEMERALSDMLEQDLVAILKLDIEARLNAYRQHGLSPATKDGDYFSEGASTKEGTAETLAPLNTNVAAVETVLSPSKPPASPFGHSARELSSADSDLASRITPLIVGLAKTGGLEKAVAAYREVAIKAVQETWKASLSERSVEMAETVKWLLSEDLSKFDDHERLPPPAARIRDLEYSAFLEIGRELFEILIECLKTIDAQSKLMPRILDQLHASTESNGTADDGNGAADLNGPSSGLPTAPIMPQGVPTNLPSKLHEVVVASAEQAHTLCARLLSFRATTHATLELPPFLVIFQLCWSFVLSSEQLCRKMIVGLRGTVLSQAKGFLANFHRRRIERAAKAVEEETWAQAEVGAEIQAQIRQIVSSAVEDPAEFVVTGSEPVKIDSKADAESSADQDGAAMSKTLDIEDRQYFVVDASLDVLSLLVDYLKVIINLPLLTTEAMARVVEFLKQFNSRTCQVVLGAGAMRSAGLKNITAKHLALASQSLSIMISLIPYIRETVRRHLSPKQAVMLTEFDKLRRDFQEHQYEIHAKLVAIMSDRLTVHCRTLSNIDWNADKPAAEDADGEAKELEPNKYAADLVKETATLHKVLSKYLQAVVVEHVIGQVLRSIDVRIAQELEKVQVQHQNALDRMQVDVRYFGTKLSTLKHVEWKDEALQKVLESKRIVPPPAVNASAGTSTPNADTAPGSPAIDKPGASPFGPVTYKPRIPNIFARRQQQQSQQGSPRGSTDVTGASTPMESRQSVEASPRPSLQQPSAPATQMDQQQNEAPAPQIQANSNAAGAQSIEDEVNEVPPTPPAKSQEAASASTVMNKEADGRESEYIVAPVVPAPEAVARVLSEGTAETPNTDAEAPSAPVIGVDAQSGEEGEGEKENESSEATEAKAEETIKTESSREESSHATHQPAEAAAISTNTTQSQPSTPAKKDAPTVNVQDATAESSPARSSVSTPAATTPTSTATSAAAKPGRMSLKERLAEAARKRAQASAPATRPTSQPETAAAFGTAVVEEAKREEPSKPAASAEPEKEAESTPQDKAVAEEGKAENEHKAEAEPNSAKLAASTEKVSQQEKKQAKVERSQESSQGAPTATLASASEAASAIPTTESEEANAEKASETETSAAHVADKPVVEDAEPAKIIAAATDEEAKVAEPAPAVAVSSKGEEAIQESQSAAGADTTPATPVIGEGEGDADADGDADEDGDGDGAEADGGANEGTNDSAVTNTSGSGSKKNKTKKKKGKKK